MPFSLKCCTSPLLALMIASATATALVSSPSSAEAQGIVIARAAQEAESKGFLEEALELYQDALDEGDLSAEHQAFVLNNVGLILQDLGELDEALSAFEESHQRNPFYVDPLYNVGLLQELRGNSEAAMDAYTRALQASSEEADIYFARARLYQSMGEHDRAIDDLAQAAFLNGELLDRMVEDSNVYKDKLIGTPTVEDFIFLLENRQETLEDYLERVRALMRIGLFEKALEELRAYLDLEPLSEEGHTLRPVLFYCLGKYDRSILAFDTALARSPNGAELFYLRGLLYQDLGDNYNARFDLQMATRIDPANETYRKAFRAIRF
ncbi:tetratricopeptide repeat protein [Kiloniella sp. b19]|uniref:tetratricopeptide repeat protein n=1 Tax=Kiloniella sp. GXU_MW_B19 TaxID=3141326 RepID=UPI0031CF940A